MIHVYSKFNPTEPETARRHSLASRSWQGQGWVDGGVYDEELTKHFLDGKRKIPYVNDLLNFACSGEDENEIIVFTNSDIITRSNCSSVIAAMMQDTHALYCHRRDFNHRLNDVPADLDFVLGDNYAGVDLIAFRVYWWRAYREFYPEMLLAFEAWDCLMYHLIRMTNPDGKFVARDLICHERHASRWEQVENRKTLPGQRHNLRQAFNWLTKYGINPAQHGIANV